MHGRPCRRKPTRKAKAGRNSVHAVKDDTTTDNEVRHKKIFIQTRTTTRI